MCAGLLFNDHRTCDVIVDQYIYALVHFIVSFHTVFDNSNTDGSGVI